jgi:hypothetical protein
MGSITGNPTMTDNRGSWYLLTAIILGVGLGLLYSWVISPTEYTNTLPASLDEEAKDVYRSLIAAAFEASGNLQRAKARLDLLNDEDPSLALVIQAQRYLAKEDGFEDAQKLANLASVINQVPTAVASNPTDPPKETIETKSATNTLLPTQTLHPTSTLKPTEQFTTLLPETLTDTPKPTATSTSESQITPTIIATNLTGETSSPSFQLVNQLSLCDPVIGMPVLQVYLANAAGIGIPGIEIIVTWIEGEVHLFTGRKPDIDPGFADFVMTPGTIYTLQIGVDEEIIRGITPQQCTDEDGETYWGGLRFVFSNP